MCSATGTKAILKLTAFQLQLFQQFIPKDGNSGYKNASFESNSFGSNQNQIKGKSKAEWLCFSCSAEPLAVSQLRALAQITSMALEM